MSDEKEEQIKALVEDLIQKIPLKEIFSQEFEQGFTEEQQKIMDEAEKQSLWRV